MRWRWRPGYKRLWLGLPDALFDELLGGLAGPVAIGEWAGGAGVEDAADFEASAEGVFGTLSAGLRKGTNAYDPFGIEGGDDFAEVGVAELFHGLGFAGGELVRGAVATAFLHENEGAVIGHKMLLEEVFSRAKTLGEEAPEAAAADFGVFAGKAGDAAFGVLVLGMSDFRFDLHPVAYRGDFAKGHAGLGHAEGARVHADEDDTFFAFAVTAEVELVRNAGVFERIVNVGRGRGEGEGGEAAAEITRGLDESGGGGHDYRTAAIFLAK